jgi:hypothetical protein
MSELKNEIQFCQVTPVLDTNAYAANDTLFTTTLVPGKFYSGRIKGVIAIDKDDGGEAGSLYFFNTNVSFGAFNVVPAPSDADAISYLGTVAIAAGFDFGANRVTYVACDIPFASVDGKIYVAGVTTTALTHTASGMVYNIIIEKYS